MKTLHTIYMNFAKRFAIVLFFFTTLGITSAWAATGTLSISMQNGTIPDSQGNTWTITTVGTTSNGTTHGEYYQIGSASSPAISITLTMTFPTAQKVTTFSAKFSGYSSEAKITLKVGNTIVGEGALTTSHDINNPVTINSSSVAVGNTLTVSVTNITNAVNIYNLSYTYESATTQEVTWIVDGEEEKADIPEGTIEISKLPTDPDNCSPEVVFVGWTANPNVDGSRPADLFNRKTPNSNLPIISNTNNTFYAVYATQTKAASEYTDEITRATTGVTGDSYGSWSEKKVASDAVYAGYTAGGNSSIQLNDKNQGIITTASGGKVKKVVVEWNTTNTTNGRTLNIYGSNKKYDAVSDLFDVNEQGTLLGSIVKGTSTELTITGDYEFIGLRSNAGAMYITSIAITWESEGSFENYTTTCSVDVTVTLNPNGGTGDFTGWTLDGNKYIQTVEKGYSVTLPKLNDQIAYTFGGWSDGTTTHVAGTYTPEADVELIAVWNAKPLKDYRTLCTYDILLDKNSTDAGSVDGSATVTSTYTLLENITAPTRTGYTIEGYYAEATCTTKVVGVDGTLQSGVAGYTDADGKWIAEDIQVLYTKWTANQYTITFDQQGGQGGTESVEATYGNKLPDITIPTREGYSFGGYFTEADGAGTQYYNIEGTAYHNKIWNETAPRTLYAKWTAHTYVVKFNANGGFGVMDDQTFTYDQAQPLSANAFTRTGYTFTTWNDKTNGTGTSYADKQSVINLTSTKGGQKTIYAQWTANTNTPYVVEHYQQKLDGSYPTIPTDKEPCTGTTDATVTPPTKTYEGFTSPATQKVTIAANGSLVVRYEYKRNSYKLTWDLAGGDITTVGTDDAGNVLYGTELKAPRVAKVDNVFMGWEPEVPATMPAHDATYVAQWIELTNFRTFCKNSVTWVVNGGKWADGTTADIVNIYTRGQEIIPPTDPTLEGWKFMGWDPEFVEGTTMQGNDHIYTAQWKELIPTSLQWSEEAYTATMEADNDFPDLTILPNDFAGVLTYQSSKPAVATIAADGTITLVGEGTTTITASFAGNDTYAPAADASYTLTVNPSNCRWVEVTDNTTLEDGDEVVITMTKGNYVWTISNEKNTSSAPTANDITANIQGNYLTTVSDEYKWVIEKNNANLTFYSYSDNANYLYCTNDANGNGVRVGTGTAKVFVVDGNYLKNTQTTDPRYVGISYNTTPYSWRCYTVTTGVIADETLKFYKRECLDSEHYWLTWDANDGQFADGSKQIVKDYAVGTTINKPFDPTRTGYEFAGWSTDGVNVVTPAENMPNENLTYIAVWKIKSYTVTWDANGGQFDNSETIIEQKYEYGATITKPADPTRTGYTFTGWAPNVPTNMSTENLNFKAQWQVNQYTVTWNPNDGNWHGQTENKVVTYDYGAPIVLPEDPVRGGWVFDGWEPTPATTMPANHLEYTAQWGKAYCEGHYTFHTGTNAVWDNPIIQNCFEKKAGTETEWQIEDYVIPAGNDHTHFLVAFSGWPQRDQGSLGGHSKSATSTWSETMYFAPAMDFNSAENSPKVGHAAGARGTLRIFDDSSWDNLCVGFIPDGYMLKFGADEYEFIHYENTEYRSEIVEYNSTTANNNVSVGIISNSGNYVKTDHTQEGMRHIFVRDDIGWTNDGAKVAIYYWSGGNSGWSGFLTKVPGETNLYVGLIPVDYTNIKLIRYKDTYAEAPGSWDRNEMWNETGDLTISTTQQLLTFSDWNSNPTTSTYKHKGKFRIYNDSRDKNWYVHFYPHYVITFDKNAADAEGSMPPQALPLDANPMTIVLNECTFERRGYDFTGWETDVAITADGNSVAANGNVKDKATISNINKDITLKAQWKAQAYTITYKDQGDVAYSGENLASLPKTHTYDQTTTLVAGVKTGYTFGGWYLTSECDGTAVTELGAQDYTADITLYAKWTFAMEYNITNTETIFITSAKGQTIKATTPLQLAVSNMPVGTKVAISAPNITFYDEAGNAITEVATKSNPEQFNLAIAYTPTVENTTEQPTIMLSVLGNEKTFDGHISARSLPNTFAIVAKVGSMWYALPSQGLSSTSDLVGYPVEVDNQDDPTLVAYVPENADWSLCQVYKSTGTDDRFGANGDNILFVNGEDNALNASRTEGYVLTEAGYARYQTTTDPDLYEWTPTTTDLETYQLTNAYRNRKLSIDILTRFGVYAGEITDMRFLPIQGRYTQAALQVVEWKENSLVIMYNGDPDQQATLAINGVNVGSAQLRAAEKDFAVYELPANGLVNQPTQRLLITIGSEQKWLTIPYIISGDKTDVEVVASTSADIVTATDVFILKGAKFSAKATSQNSQCRFRNVTVYGGGKLVIGSGTFLSMNSIILRAGGITDAGEYDYVYPQFDLQGTLTNSAGEFKYDYITDNEHWYHLVLPFDGKIKSPSIKYPVEFYGSNVATTNTGSWIVKRYDGATRSTGNYNAWVDIETEGAESITAGKGYIYWGAPKRVTVNGDTQRQKWGIQRIVMSKGAEKAKEAENANKTISGLGSYENVANNSDNVYDQGWNLIGNPYMVNLTGLNSRSLKAGQLIEELDTNGNWTGGWVLDSINATLRYITVPSDHFEWYTAEKVSKNMTLVAGRAFFVQIDGTATDVMFEAANRAQLMPALRAAHNDEPVDIETGIVLSNETLQDEVNFWIADGMTNDYEYNADYPKTPNTNNFNIYGVHTNGHLSWVAISPEIAAESMPIGYQVPAAGTYMLSVSEEYYSDEVDALLVTDHEMSPEVTTDLMITSYEFSVNQAETNNKRFTVAIKLKNGDNNDATGLDNLGIGNEHLMKFIYQDKIYILHHGVIYDATGKRVITINK